MKTRLIIFLSLVFVLPQAPRKRTVWEGVYTTEQAARGKQVWTTVCVACHPNDLDDNPNARLRGEPFMREWGEYHMGPFYGQVKTMPNDKPGSLGDDKYLDVMSYILQVNGFPEGKEPLKVEDLRHIQIEGRTGPKQLASGTLALVIGCLAQNQDDGWFVLGTTTDPIRTETSREATPEELDDAQYTRLGRREFWLQNLDRIASEFRAADHIGAKILAKGYVIWQTNRNRVDVTTTKVLSDTCEP